MGRALTVAVARFLQIPFAQDACLPQAFFNAADRNRKDHAQERLGGEGP